jgi:hypothetical protein
MTFLLVFSRSGDTLTNADIASLGRLRGVGAKCAQAVMSLQTHKAHLHLHASIMGPLKIGFPRKRASPVAGQRASNLSLLRASPAPPAKRTHPARWLFSLEAVPLGAAVIDFGVQPSK